MGSADENQINPFHSYKIPAILNYDHSYMTIGYFMPTTHTIPAGKFKTKCLQLMDEVHNSHISLTITKHGKPVAMLVPLDDTPPSFFGCLKGTVTINDDIIAPIDVIWEADK